MIRMNFIKELFEGNQEQDWIHQMFTKYGRGEFPGPYISMKKSGDFLRINSSADYVNILGMMMVKTSPGSLRVEGSILSREKIESYIETVGLDISKVSKKKGIFNYKVKGEADSKALAELYSKVGGGSLLLNLDSSNKTGLKVKKKLPKAGSKQDERFCTGTLNYSDRIIDEVCFDVDIEDFKEIEVSHTYAIDELIVPEDCGDFSLARVVAKRRGSVKRSVKVDGSSHESERELLV